MPSAAPADPVQWVPTGPKRLHHDVFRVSTSPMLHCRPLVIKVQQVQTLLAPGPTTWIRKSGVCHLRVTYPGSFSDGD